jgi:hypothetical protein
LWEAAKEWEELQKAIGLQSDWKGGIEALLTEWAEQREQLAKQIEALKEVLKVVKAARIEDVLSEYYVRSNQLGECQAELMNLKLRGMGLLAR